MIISLAAAVGLSLSAQTAYDRMLTKIEANNQTLKALRLSTDASRLSNRTDLTLANPEVGFAYQWADPKEAHDKMTIEVSQEFDFPTLSGNKGRVAAGSDRVTEAEYLVARREVMAEAETTLTNLAYNSRLCNLYDGLLSSLQEQIALSKTALDKGEISIVDYKTLQLQLVTLKADQRTALGERSTLLADLQRLNGGLPTAYETADYSSYELPADFEAWSVNATAANPSLLLARRQVELSRTEKSLAKSEGLPTFSLGYAGEICKDANYHGVALGLQLPFWANRGKVKAAQAKIAAAEAMEEDERAKLLSEMKSAYDNAANLGALYAEVQQLFTDIDFENTLDRQLEAGDISALERMEQTQALSDLYLKQLEIERDYRLALIVLRSYE